MTHADPLVCRHDTAPLPDETTRCRSAVIAGCYNFCVPSATASHVATLPPVSTLFAAFLGSNPIHHLLGDHVLNALPPANAAHLTGREFFPSLISGPFHHGLVIVFVAAATMALAAAAASALRGARYVHTDKPTHGTPAEALDSDTAPATR